MFEECKHICESSPQPYVPSMTHTCGNNICDAKPKWKLCALQIWIKCDSQGPNVNSMWFPMLYIYMFVFFRQLPNRFIPPRLYPRFLNSNFNQTRRWHKMCCCSMFFASVRSFRGLLLRVGFARSPVLQRGPACLSVCAWVHTSPTILNILDIVVSDRAECNRNVTIASMASFSIWHATIAKVMRNSQQILAKQQWQWWSIPVILGFPLPAVIACCSPPHVIHPKSTVSEKK